ncbi:MAG: hypothetical protein HYT78_03860 [Deltaproteobacteria bacterium]|nr:hypothetical protein [Deltaproteobacteria bacterium]
MSPHGHLTIGSPLGDGAVGLNLPVLDRVDRKSILKDIIRLRKAPLDIALSLFGIVHDIGIRHGVDRPEMLIVTQMFMDKRSARLSRGHRIENGRQFLVLDLD